MNNQAELSNISNVLCGVDGSEPACRAAALAAQLASALDVKLTYLTVAREIEPRGDFKGYLEAEGLKGQSVPLPPSEAEECLDQALSIARNMGAAKAERVVKTGDVANVICDVAGQIEADCIVLGRHGKGAVRSLLTGSVSKDLAEKCDMTLILVK